MLLHKILDLKTTCMKPEICKAGFPINSLEKYTEKLCEKKFSFIVYYFNQETEELEVVIDYNGKFKNKEERNNINCYICKHSTKYYKPNDKYILAVARLYAKEGKEEKDIEIKEQEEKEKWCKINQKKKKTYKHGGYTSFYVTEPKVRKIEKSRYLDRIVHRWLVDNFLAPAFVPKFIPNSYACLKQRGMHRAAIYVQDSMKHCKRIWNEYYILKMDIAKYFDNINKEILLNIIKRKIKDENILWLINEILYAQEREKGLETIHHRCLQIYI